MSYTPSSAAQAVAVLAGSNQASLASALTALQASIASGNLAPAALIDAILSGVGFQLESNNVLGSANTSSTSLAEMPGSSVSFVAPLAKTYLVHADVGVYSANSSGKGTQVTLQLVVNGSAGPAVQFCISPSQSNPNVATFRLMHAAPCAAGANAIAVNWAAMSGSGTIYVSSACSANYVVTG